MKTARIIPATVDWAPESQLSGPEDAHSNLGHRGRESLSEVAVQVFLGGNGLPERWQHKPRFVILETGFGVGHRFLTTWAAWKEDPAHCTHLCFLCIEASPPTADTLRQAHADGPHAALATSLSLQWPPPIPGLHVLNFDGGQVQLLLAWGDLGAWLPEIAATVDAFFLGDLAPEPEEDTRLARLLNHCARLGAADATASARGAAEPVCGALRTAGYAIRKQPSAGSPSGWLSAQRLPSAHRGPKAKAPEGRRSAPRCRTALVIGAGLAGAAAAKALAAQGVAVTVLERNGLAASAASGNVAGLFHGVVHPADGVHARVLRAAALYAETAYKPLLAQGRVTGSCRGLLRGVRTDAHATPGIAGAFETLALTEMRALLNSQGLPPDYAQALNSSAASELAGVELVGAWWHFPGGGWLAPRELVAEWLAEPGVTTRFACSVAVIEPRASGGWRALDGSGHSLGEADVMVVASASDSVPLLCPWTDAALWPLQDRRGQITQLSAPLMDALWLKAPALPLANAGYAIGLPAPLGGGMVCGATSHVGDACMALRIEDHMANLAQAEMGRTATPKALTTELRAALLERHATGRVGWRQVSADRLPLVGPAPMPVMDKPNARKLEQPRHVPRVEGLYVLCGLGSRGITLAPLLGQALAAWVTGWPQPVGADLLDAMDPARFLSKRLRSSTKVA